MSLNVVTVIAILLSSSLAHAEAKVPTSTCDWLGDHARIGDLVFIEIPNELFRKVARASGGWTSHVGVVAKNPRGRLVVYESTLPRSKETALCDFLDRSYNERFVLRRLVKPLSFSDELRIGFEARKRLGVDYDLGFNLDSKKQFCSKYVSEIFEAVFGSMVGQIEKFGELMDRLEGHPKEQGDLLFWNAYFFGHIPKERRTISPHSQLHDPQFFTVIEHHAQNY